MALTSIHSSNSLGATLPAAVAVGPVISNIVNQFNNKEILTPSENFIDNLHAKIPELSSNDLESENLITAQGTKPGIKNI